MKATSSLTSLPCRLLVGILIVAMAIQPGAFANPAAPVIRHGAAEFNFDNPAHLLIQQGSDKLIVDWGEFNISAGELTQFIQPGSGSAALNRVMSALPSSIQGQLQANGRVLLINPNGVLIGPGGRIDTAGFIASTLDVSDADFLAGGDLRFQGDSLAKVVNLGTINAIDGGDIFLIAREVVNAGTLNAPEGTVGLVAGQQIVIAAQGEERVAILPEGQEGSVTNSGTIAAATAELKAAGGNEYALAVNNTGLVRAKGFEKRGGRIYLSVGGGKGRIVNTGTLKARMEDNSGGLVQITHAGEMEGAGVDIGGRIDVKGDVGSGGMVLVTAPGIHVLPDARIDASGHVNGGQIALHSAGDEGTMIDGKLLANGSNGDGGFIHVTGSFIGLGATGEISANGGNGGGFVLLGADPEDASGQVESSQIVLAPGSRISANGMRGDGGMVLINGAGDSDVLLGGEISASSDVGVGGQVMAFGGNVSIGGTALIDASGYRGGGQVYIGGGDRGRDAGKLNAQNTSIAAGAQILANATGAGAGGRVILWADRLMDFRGSVENRGAGGGAGGFTEVSGLEYLGFNGTVDTGGGNLLLDPYSYIIGATEAGNIVTALGLNNVTIDTTMDVAAYGSSGVNTDPGDITVNSAIFYDSTFDLTFLAMGDANFNASVQNRNATGGDINIVAGWDGTTAYNTAAFVAEDVSSTTVFGNSMGSVNIGGGTQVAGVAVGSRSGASNVFGYDVSLLGGNGAGGNGRFAQLGFQVTDGIAQDGTNLGAAPVVDGAITVHALNDVSATGGDANINYVQIGHVGTDQGSNNFTTEARASSVIELSVGNNVVFMGGGGGGAYAQLGQGGVKAVGNHSGTTTITQANDISFTAGSGSAAYAQLGQGGYQANGNHSGNTTIVQANDVSFRGDAAAAYAQLGQGGWAASGDHSGTTTITRVNDIVFSAGDEWTAYAQLGQGGIFAIGDHNGTTMITQANDITFTGGGGTYTYAQLGQGGVAGQGTAVAIGDHSGTTTITQANDITFTGGGGSYAFAQLGQGGAFAGGDHSGTTTITQANDIIFTGGLGSGDGSYAQLGQGGLKAIGDHSGMTIILQANDIAFTGGSKKWSYAQLGQGGYDADGNHSGNISLTHAGNLTLSGVDTTDQYALIGHGDQPGDGDAGITVSGNVTVRTGGNVVVNNGWLGNLLDADGLSNTGSMNLVADGSITLGNLLNQGSYDTVDSYSYIAGGDVNFNSSVQNRNATGGDVNIVAGWDGTTAYDTADFVAENVSTTTVFGNGGGSVFIGDGSQTIGVAMGSRSGQTNVFGYDVILQGGTGGYGRFSQLGFQVTDGIAQDGTDIGAAPVVNGGVVVHVRNDVRAMGGDSGAYEHNYAQIGHVGADQGPDLVMEATVSSVIELSAGNNVSFSGGDGDFAYAQLGQGGYRATGNFSGTTTITQANDVSFSGGAETGAYAQLGHGGYSAEGDHSGNISLTHRGNLTLSGVDTTYVYALIGHGDQPGDGDAGKTVGGNVTVSTGGNVVVNKGWVGNLLDADGLSNTGSMTLAADGSITLDNLLNQGSYDTADTYSYIAGGDVNFNSSVQNRNATGGDINIVAGWDGTTVYDTAVFAAENVSTTTVFGRSMGTVYIGNGGQAVGVAVGSRSGASNVFAYDVSLQGGNGAGADGRFSQLGFQVTDELAQDGTNLGPAPVVDGGIVVHVRNDVRATGGDSGNHNYVQIGHVGADQISDSIIEAVASSVIELSVGNNIVFTGGGGNLSYAQLGQGGDNAFGNHSGTTTITRVNDIVFTGGAGFLSYAQLGQGGNNAIGDHGGIVTITQANDIVFTGVGIGAYAQLGQGGNIAVGNHTGTTTIAQANNIVFTGGAGDLSYAQLGQGGAFANGNHSGTATVEQANNIIFMAGGGDFAYAQLGQGGAFAIGNHSGTTTINLAHDVRFLGGGGANAYAQLGQGGVGADGNHSGNISLLHTGNLTLTGLDVTDRYALIGHGDESGDGDASHTVSGDVSIRTTGNTMLTNAFIGHLVDSDGSYTSGNTFIGLAGDLTADSASAFTSAPTSDLRFYVAGNDNVNALTLLNGVAHGAAPYPNNQGAYAFGTGPYVPAAGTNFAYYTLAAFYNYNVDTLAETTAIQAALEGGSDVTLAYNIQGQASFGAEYDWGGGPYFIHFDSDLFYDSPNTLNLLATGEVIFNASVQNRNAVGGDVNIVAGWDGITAFDAATFAAEDVAGTSVFGAGMGSVIIGDGSQTGGVAVGSRSGLTGVFGYDVTLQGGTGAGVDERFSQLGFKVSNGIAQGGANLGATPLVNGGITVHTLNDVRATGGDSGILNYAQIGHVGADIFFSNSTVEAVATSVIEMSVGNDVVFTGGSGDSAYVQLGQGGIAAYGNHSGTVTVTQAGDITFAGGGGTSAYAQLGQGGDTAFGNHSGNTTISQANNLTFMAGGGWGAYAQLGQGGLFAIGDHSGMLTVMRAEDIVFTGGGGNFAYAQLGQGGSVAIGDHSGNISLTQAGNLILTGVSAEKYARVGNGEGTGDDWGDVMIRAEGDVTLVKASIGNRRGPAKTYIGVLGDLTADAASNFYSGSSASSGELRFYLDGNDNVNSATLLNGMAHGGTAFPNNQGSFGFGTGPYTLPGPMNPIAGNFNYYSLTPGFYNHTVNTLLEVNAIQAALEGGSDVTLTYNLNQANFGAEYDWDGGTQFIRFDSDLFYDSTNTLNLLATGDALFNASVQNGNATGGDINIVAGWDGTTPYNTGVFVAEDVNSTTVFGVGNGTVNIGDGSQVRGVAVGSRSGMTNVFGYDVSLQGGTGAGADGRFAQLGFQVSDQGAAYVVDGGITVHANHDVIASGGDTSLYNYAQIGHVGVDQNSDSTIEAMALSVIELSVGNNISFQGGSGDSSYVQLGQGGYEAVGDYSGTTMITQANDVTFLGGAGFASYAQLGQGVFDADGNHSGTTTVTQANDVTFLGGAGEYSFAQLGQGGAGAYGDHDGMTTVMQANDVTFLGGVGDYSFAQLGQGGYYANGNHSGTTTVTQANDVIFSGGAGAGSYAQLGQGGYFSEFVTGSHSGTTTLTQANDVTFSGGAGEYSYAQLGQGGYYANGNHGGTTTVTQANDVTFSGGAGDYSYAQLGQGGYLATGNHSGTATVTQVNDVTFSGGVGYSSWVQLGQGGLGSIGDHSGTTTLTQAYDVSFTGGDGFFAYAQLGHGGDAAFGNHSGTTTLTQVNDVTFSGGAGYYSPAQLGQGGHFANGNHSGTTTITQANDVTFSGGAGDFSNAQLGQGGALADGNHSGTTTVAQVNNVTFLGGSGGVSNAQLGQGGAYADGNHSGSIDVTHSGNFILTGVDVTESYALIGHGDQPGDGDAGHTVSGNVMLRTGGNTTLTNAFIGHLIDPDGTYTSGNTFIGVGSVGGPELLTTDANSGFFSAPTGQLRFYIPGPMSNQIAAGASLNGTPALGPGITPNSQGAYAFGLGPYNLVDPGNFAFYTLAFPPVATVSQSVNNLPGMVILPFFGNGLSAASFPQDIRFIRPVVFERDSWMQWNDYGIEGFVDFLPNRSMYTVGSFEVDPEEGDE